MIDPELKTDKVFDVKVGGKPLELARSYTVATIMGSNDEPGVVNGKLLNEVAYSMELLDRYISAHSPIAFTADGRISTGKKPH